MTDELFGGGYVQIMHGDHVAFFYRRDGLLKNTVHAAYAMQPDLQPVVEATVIRCYTCGEPFDWPEAMREARRGQTYEHVSGVPYDY